jgi:hypothetical protein
MIQLETQVTAKIGNPVPGKDAFYAYDILGSVQAEGTPEW